MLPLGQSPRYAWVVVALLVPVALLNYLDRQMLATMKASMVGDIPTIANRADWGLILGSFKWTYALLGPIAGYISDSRGSKLSLPWPGLGMEIDSTPPATTALAPSALM